MGKCVKRMILGYVNVGIVLGFYIVGLWPFNFAPRNNVQWVSGKPGIHLERYSVAYSQHPLILNHFPTVGDRAASFSIELFLQAGVEPRSGVPHIFSLYDGELPENLVIGQWKSELLLRAPFPDRLPNRYREIGVEAALKIGRIRFLTITGDVSGATFYLDGAFVRRYPKYVLSSNLLRGQMVLGDSVTGGGAWKGYLFGVAVFGRALDAAEVMDHYAAWIGGTPQRLAAEPGLAALYLFDQRSGPRIADRSDSRLDFVIPQKYHVLHKTILLPPWRDSLLNVSHAEDIAVNILGFIPFGFLFFLYCDIVKNQRRIANAFCTVLVSLAVSLSIELIQVFLPSRSSSTTDLLCNILGTVLGMLFARVFYGAIMPDNTAWREAN